MTQKLWNKPEILKGMPELGRIVPELEKENIKVRELLEKPYRIVYEYKDDVVTILPY